MTYNIELNSRSGRVYNFKAEVFSFDYDFYYEIIPDLDNNNCSAYWLDLFLELKENQAHDKLIQAIEDYYENMKLEALLEAEHFREMRDE